MTTVTSEMLRSVTTRGEEETIGAGKDLAGRLVAGDVVALYGDLGSGKTRFAQGVCRGLGIGEHVASPTFTILNEYTGGRLPVYHFDFYRIRSPKELDEIGFEEYLYGRGVSIIEWAEVAADRLPGSRYEVYLRLGAERSERFLEVQRHDDSRD